MTNTTTVPSADQTDEDPLADRPVLVQSSLWVTRGSPIKVSGSVGTRHTGLRVGEGPVSFTVLSGAGDTRLTELMHLEVFLVKALGHVRVALRDEADHVEDQARRARHVEITDRDDESSVRAS
ncbi:hypothetical protein K6U06_06470 [Acidiferrimicrobium sp. IK]|uniref:hypothetical protein n=1 Tax=Acidiferrimicrobium sp. IK TaxID=2871700 RepID=UPI0021CB851B|nr:hypothetical protein [Acidiferrimicrobium sp. IK]MCU4183997.1 hypothetical protein [Acidiferrimicrobium sp. IK]